MFANVKQSALRVWMKYQAWKGMKHICPVDRAVVRRIALWQFGGLGDMLLATPVICALGEKWPDAELHLYCSHPQFADFLRHFPNVKGVHAFPVYDFDARTLLYADMRCRLRAVGDDMRAVAPDMLINLHVPAMLDWWAVEWWLTGKVHAPFSLGFNPRFVREGSVFDVSLNASQRDNTHYTVFYRQLLEKAGIKCDSRTEFPVSDVERKKAKCLLADCGISDKRWVCVHIGGNRLKLEGKLWPVGRFTELAGCLNEAGFSPVLVGVQQERDLGEVLCTSVPACVNLIGCTQMGEMAALIEMACSFIGHDSGPFHVAAAVGTPCVVICGRPDAEPEYLKYDSDSITVLIAPSPELISVDAVFSATMQIIDT